MMIFATFLAAFLLSSIAAYYSVVGLTTIFVGAFWPIVIMGTSLELAKLVTTSWLYHNWKKSSVFLRAYLTGAVIVLMLITSMGIFGFLAKSHIDSTQESTSNNTELSTLVEQENIAKERLQYLLARAKDPATASIQLDRQIQAAQADLTKLSKKKAPLLAKENKLIAEIGPLFYIANVFYDNPDGAMDKAVRLVIMAIMFVFDPLAILLVIAGNIMLKEKKLKDHPEPIAPAPGSSHAVVVQTPVAPTPPTDQVPLSPPAVSASPQHQAEADNQMLKKQMTSNDVRAAFRIFYGRDPGPQDNVESLSGKSSKEILEIFYNSSEFLSRSGATVLILQAAKKIQDYKQQSG